MLTAPTTFDRRARRSAMDALVAVVLLSIIFLAIWFVWLREAEEPADPRAVLNARSQEWYVTTYGSDGAVISGILAMTDCAGLDAAFADAAVAFRAANATEAHSRAQVGIMSATADRMNEIGCPRD